MGRKVRGIEKALDQKDVFRRKGFKATPQRLMITQVIRDSMGHLSSEDVFERVKTKLPGVSRATVYNALHTLAACGEIRELILNQGSVLYDSNSELHHHFVCEGTGEIVDIPGNAVRQVSLKGLEKDYKIRSYSIVFRGSRRHRGRKRLKTQRFVSIEP